MLNTNQVLPLLVALELKRSALLVSAILTRFPDAARYPDPSGRLPLHAALEASAPLSVLQALAAAYPRALNMPVSMVFFFCAAAPRFICTLAILQHYQYLLREMTEKGRSHKD